MQPEDLIPDPPLYIEAGLAALGQCVRDHDLEWPGDNVGADLEVPGIFSMHSYCWCSLTADEGESCERCDKPNFLYIPTGFGVYWYKYLGRGMETRGEIPSGMEWLKMMWYCADALDESLDKGIIV